MRRRTQGSFWVEEPFGPTGTEHTLEFLWPRKEQDFGHGIVNIRFAAGSEARIVPSGSQKRCRQTSGLE